MLSKWLDVLAKISQSPDCNCPVCNSLNVHVAFKNVSGEWGYTVIWCEDCKHAGIVSRSKKEKYFHSCDVIPKNLVF